MFIENKKVRIILCVIFWIVTALLAFIIFGFSAQNGAESASLSDKVREFLCSLTGISITPAFMSSFAHFIEYCAFSFSLFFALSFSFNRTRPVMTVFIAAVYAATDEIHQLFSDGRVCDIKDFLVDASGALITVLILSLMINLFSRIKQRRSNHE